MYKIAAVGDYDSVCGFGALGIDIYPTDTAEDAKRIINNLTADSYGIIYVTDKLIEKLPDIYEKYSQMKIPAIVPLPSVRGATAFGMENVRKYVIQAVGSDIIFND